MKPKRKSKIDYVLYAVVFAVVIWLAAHMACALNETNASKIELGSASGAFMMAFNNFTERMVRQPFNLYVCENTWRLVFWCAFVWAIIVLMLENRKRNYIRGKEFGTARWGTINDIKDLFAENIKKEEIKQAKKMRTGIGRWFAKRKLYRQCEKNGKKQLKEKINTISQYKAGNKEEYRQGVKKAKAEIRESVEDAKIEAWEPDRIAKRYGEKILDVENEPLYSPEEKEKEKEKLEQQCEEEKEEFRNTSKRIKKITEKYEWADMPLTKTEHISIYNHQLNNNTLVLGGSGSGKTRSYVMPNILQAHSSYIVTDPKGEILEKAGQFLTDNGYIIRVLNLDDKAKSDQYNPFKYIYPERPGYEERVLSLIETIIVNTDNGKKKESSDPFWDRAERLFLQAIFFFVAKEEDPNNRNMNRVLELIGMLKMSEEGDDLNSELDQYVQNVMIPKFGEDFIGVRQYREFREKATGKTAMSIVITAVARFAPFRANEVQRIFENDTMELDKVGERRGEDGDKKTAIFVVVPPTDDSFNFIAGMLFTQLFQELQYCATQVHKHDGQRLPVPCRFILDEFANTCTIPNFVKILAYARSFGIGITIILQSLEQIKKMYKDEWGVIIDNCNTLLFLGSISHMDTLEYISKLLGKGTYDKKTSGHTYGSKGSSSENFDVIGRELMTADEIRKLERDKCLLFVGGRNPFYSDKYEYKEHKNYRYTSDANEGNRLYSYEHVPKRIEAKPKVKEQEKPKKEEKNPELKEAMDYMENMETYPDKIKYVSEFFKDIQTVFQKVIEKEPLTAEEEDIFIATWLNIGDIDEKIKEQIISENQIKELSDEVNIEELTECVNKINRIVIVSETMLSGSMEDLSDEEIEEYFNIAVDFAGKEKANTEELDRIAEEKKQKEEIMSHIVEENQIREANEEENIRGMTELLKSESTTIEGYPENEEDYTDEDIFKDFNIDDMEEDMEEEDNEDEPF